MTRLSFIISLVIVTQDFIKYLFFYYQGGRVVSIGITPWGIVDRRNELLGKKREVALHPVPQPR